MRFLNFGNEWLRCQDGVAAFQMQPESSIDEIIVKVIEEEEQDEEKHEV